MNHQIEAINLMLHDLGLLDEALLHRASFHGCSRELQALRQELRGFLLQRRHGAGADGPGPVVPQRTNSISW
jgi:hypothetical protein